MIAAPHARADVAPRQVSGKPVVAVLPFSSPSVWSSMGRNAQATFVTQLVNSGRLRVVQAGMVLRMLRRYGLRWTGVLQPSVMRAARRYLRAQYVLAGKLRHVGDAYILSVHVMDATNLQTTVAQDVDFRSYRKMRIAVRVAARRIAAKMTGGSSRGSNADMFLNVNARAFYDGANAAMRALGWRLSRYQVSGTVDSVDSGRRTVKVRGYGGRLRPGIPFNIMSSPDSLDGPKTVATAYFTRRVSGGFEVKVRGSMPEDGIALGAAVTNRKYKWAIAVGRIVDEAGSNEKLARRFRKVLLDKMSEGNTSFQQIEGNRVNRLARMSSRRRRFFAYRSLWKRGVEMVLEGKFYGSPGSRRAHFKVYSTLTGRVIDELKFETRL
ncbi:MAG: hypothetical protein KC503_11660 [Myxococcales bacterium]|nr:hypothetical protein [Myxococcales bacterium]